MKFKGFRLRRGKSMETVKDWFDWRNKNGSSIEEQNSDNKYIKDWKYKDVLYSFLGIYTIGLWIYYPKEFERTPYTIRPIARKKSNKVSFDYLCPNDKSEGEKYKYIKYVELNNLEELKSFIKVYTCAGNVIPVWPGANIHRGMGYCFDIPDIYFRNPDVIEWTKTLMTINEKAYLDEIMESNYPSYTEKFLDRMSKNKKEYKGFLKHCISIINNRNTKLS